MKIAIIPARGGSKRIPRKNLKAFCGKPIIGYSIDAARSSGVFDHVIVSTDDAEIAAVARDLGAETPFMRPRELADDHTTTVPVIRHAVQWVGEHLGPVTHACCIYATAPFVQAASLRAAHDRLVAQNVTGYVFSATTFPFPIQRAFKVSHDDGHVEMFWPENYNARSQDLPEAYQDAGQFYWGTAEAYLGNKIFFSTDSLAQVLPRYLVQDIDTPEDWKRAELMYQVLRDSGELA
jgi:pseudaminic acid cytidylyltransferase